MFDRAGLPVPRTWDDVLEAARRLNGNNPIYVPPNASAMNATATSNSTGNFSVNLTSNFTNASYATTDPPPFYGLCITRNAACPYTSFNLAAILAPMLVVNGTVDGFYFDPDTMQPLVRNAAMRRALEILRCELPLLSYGMF